VLQCPTTSVSTVNCDRSPSRTWYRRVGWRWSQATSSSRTQWSMMAMMCTKLIWLPKIVLTDKLVAGFPTWRRGCYPTQNICFSGASPAREYDNIIPSHLWSHLIIIILNLLYDYCDSRRFLYTSYTYIS